jgi:hypothetical protein
VAGGTRTQSYFDAVAATADFWSLLAAGTITFSPGTDPQGRPVLMASSGNVELRVQGVYTGPPGGGSGGHDDHPAFVVVTVIAHNTTTSVSSWLAVVARFATMPVYLPITSDLFAKLLSPLYSNTKTLLGSMADKLRDACSVETPEVDAEAVIGEVLDGQAGVVDVYVNNSGEQAVITITVEAT